MKYEERLTKKIRGYYHGKRFVGGKGVINDGKYYRGCFDATAIVDRLGELEDKIERGEIDYTIDRDKEIARLTAENAELRATLSKMETVEKELRERLGKAVELPAKIGDTVYKVYDKCDGYNCPYNGNYGQWRCHYEGERRCEPFIKIEQFCYSDIPFVNDTVFVSREAAEARLKELKENNND